MKTLLLAAACALIATSALADPVGDPSTGAKAAKPAAPPPVQPPAAGQAPAPRLSCPATFTFSFTTDQTAALQAILMDAPTRGRSFLTALADATTSFVAQAQQQCVDFTAKRAAPAK